MTMKILVVNSGSSSLKCRLYEIGENGARSLATGAASKIGFENGSVKCMSDSGRIIEFAVRVDDHSDALRQILDQFSGEMPEVVKSLKEIDGAGHRVVHGGEQFFEPVIIDDRTIRSINQYSDLAPLHNPVNIEGIQACRRLMPDIPQVAVFDTSFHQSMPATAYTYAVPKEFYEKFGIRRYGFHGISHEYVFYETCRFLKTEPGGFKAIICHIGNGASITAVDGGKVKDTSMGLTPLEGLVMGTRSGDIDPSIIFYLTRNKGLDLYEVEEILNKKSGLLGVSGLSSDVRDILKAYGKNDPAASLALDIYVYRIIKYIGAYTSALDGADAVVFTGGVGENSREVRRMIAQKLGWLGINFDENYNRNAQGECRLLTKENSPVKLLVVPTDEEYMILRKTYEKLKQIKLMVLRGV